MAQQCKEGGDCESFIAVGDDREIYGVGVKVEREETCDCVDGNHEQNSDDVPLFSWLCIIQCMHPYRIK